MTTVDTVEGGKVGAVEVGDTEGTDGVLVGFAAGAVGLTVGAVVSKTVGAIIGAVEVGDTDGRTLGEADGTLVGFTVGAVGVNVKAVVGANDGAEVN